jgi:predicted NAD/FAD-binding protein
MEELFIETNSDILIGRKITEVSLENQTLTLDNGTILYVSGNDGCACAYGNYDITHLATTENMIMSVRSDVQELEYGDTGDVRLFVMMDGIPTEKEVILAEGCDNGYYGYGFVLYIKKIMQ